MSLGLVDSTFDTDYQRLLGFADRALMVAKDEGRDALVIGDASDSDGTTANPAATTTDR